jgi:predicted metal-dependent HD superfamily phosphohydrolase
MGIKADDIYAPELVALAINFGEYIYDSYEPDSEQLYNQLLTAALSKVGYNDLSMEKLGRSIGYFLLPHEREPRNDDVVDIYSLAQYSADFPQ